MKYRHKLALAIGIFVILLAASIVMQTEAKALTRTDERTLTLTDKEAAYCNTASNDPERACLLVNKVLIEAEIEKRVRQARKEARQELETCRSYTKGDR